MDEWSDVPSVSTDEWEDVWEDIPTKPEKPKSMSKKIIDTAAEVGSNVASVVDMALGTPAFVAGIMAKATLSQAAALSGDKTPMKSARESVEATTSPWLTSPIKTLGKTIAGTSEASQKEGEGNLIERGMESFGKTMERTGEYWDDVTGTELGEAIRLGTDATMMLAPGVVAKGTKAVVKPIIEGAKSVKGSFVKPKEVAPELTPEQVASKTKYEKTKGTETETLSDTMARKTARETAEFRAKTPAELEFDATTDGLTAARRARAKVWEEARGDIPYEEFAKNKQAVAEVAKRADAVYKEVYAQTKDLTLTKLTTRQESLDRTHGPLPTADKPVTSKLGPLARTDKEGRVTLDKVSIEADFNNNFSYIFDATTPSGKQKVEVFKQLGIETPEQLKSVIPNAKAYEYLIQQHENSHVLNNDHANYPKTSEGKPDLTHSEAIAIEVRATKEALEAVQTMLAGDKLYPTNKSAMEIVAETGNQTRAKAWETETYTRKLEEEIPESIRHEITRNIDEGKPLKTDAEHLESIKSNEAALSRDRSIVGFSKHTLEDLHQMLNELGKSPEYWEVKKAIANYDHYREIAPVLEQSKIPALERVIEKQKERPSVDHLIPKYAEIQARFNEVGNRAKEAGLIEGLLDNYVTHVLDFSKTKMTPKEQAAFIDRVFGKTPKDSKLYRDFTEHRQYETIKELEKAVEGTGVVVHTDIAKVLNAYEKSMETAILHKKMLDTFQAMQSTDGKPMLLPYDTPPAQSKGYVRFTGRGSKPLEGFLVNPEIKNQLGFLFRETDPNMVIAKLSAFTAFVKSVNVVGSLFHAYNLGIAGIGASPTKTGKVVGKLAKDTVMSTVKATPGLIKGEFGERFSAEFAKRVLTEGEGINQALRAFKEGGNAEVTNLLLKEGLMVELPDVDVQRTIIADLGKSTDAYLSSKLKDSDVTLAKHITEPLDKYVLQKLNTFTWDYIHTGMKLYIAQTKFSSIKLKNPELPDNVIAHQVATHVNDTFGGLNWAQIAADSKGKFYQGLSESLLKKGALDYAQLVLFAPDWTMSTARAMTKALPEELMKPQNWQLKEGIQGLWNPTRSGDLSRRYILATSTAYFTLLNAVNIAQSGHPIWENDNPLRIDNGDGTTTQLAKHAMEGPEWIFHFWKTLGNKLAFAPKAAATMIAGVKYPSPDAPKLDDTSFTGRATEVGKQLAPFSVGSVLNAPEGKGLQRFIGSTLGMPTYGHENRASMDLDELAEYDREAKERRDENAKARTAIKQEIGVAKYKELDAGSRKKLIADKIEELKQ